MHSLKNIQTSRNCSNSTALNICYYVSVRNDRRSQLQRSKQRTHKTRSCVFVFFNTMQPWAEFFYKSTAWQRCRDAAWRRDGGLCQDCLKQGKLVAAEEVHHITPLTPLNVRNPEISLNLDNLVSLCRECHKARHGARQHRYKVDEFGRVTLL